MTQINTRGEGGGSKMVRKFNTYFLNGPFTEIPLSIMFQLIRAKPDLKKVLNQTHVFSISGIPYSLDASMSPEGRREFEI
jgi:hypothetical protein